MSRPEFNEAKAKLEAYCAYQERCSYEVREKLKQFDLSAEEVEKLILKLQADNFLNDERFARSYASGKFLLKGWGKAKIKSQLRAKRLSEELIALGMLEIDRIAYIDRAKQLAVKKMNELAKESNPWTKRTKIMRFLAGKGFEMDVIYKVLGYDDEH